MTAAVKKPSRRYSREQQQEDLSEGLFKARLAEVGWPCDRLGRDLGEDLHVRIYDDGASTGLSFYVQLKSTAKAERLTRRKTPALAYKLEVKDLLHWEVQATLVVLVVWDVEKRAGWWRPIPEIVKELDKTNKGWRNKKTATVSVPLANGTDDEGLKWLRWAVADHNLPLVPKAEKSELSLSFPNTPEGAASLAAFKRAFDEGEAVELGGGELLAPRVKYPEWHRRVYGDFDGPVRISIGRTEPSLMVPVRVDLESLQGTASLPYVELRPQAWGRRRQVLSSEQQGLPVQLRIEIADERVEARLSLVRLGRDVYEVEETATVALVMAQEQVRVRLTALTAERPTIVLSLNGTLDEATLAQMTRWRAFVDKLAFIQQRLSSQRILIPQDGVSHVDARAVERVFTILSRGTEQGSVSLSGAIALEDRALRQRALRGGRAVVSIGREEGKSIKFLNAVFEPGARRIVLKDPDSFFAEFDRQIEDARGRGERAEVRLEQIPVVYEYLKWIPEEARWDRLTQIAIRQDGYVTLSQVRRTGYTDEIFLAMIPRGKVERVASDVFRLVHFPRSDHEELIVLWLQTDRKGVISHDTALLLHELSDILPRRRHITVPPGWDPGDRQLGAKIVLHHAEVGEDEIRWLGPVPYTAPLRTLRDCIASHLSPDLIEQAVADGLQRGMFTEADLPPGARRGAA
jgi:hypothetical protein